MDDLQPQEQSSQHMEFLELQTQYDDLKVEHHREIEGLKDLQKQE